MSNYGNGTPEQILALALEEIKKYPPVNAMVIAWYSKKENGTGVMRYLHSTADGGHMTSLISDLAFENHISRRSIYGKYEVDVTHPAESEPIARKENL